MILNVEAKSEAFPRQSIRVHGHNILEADGFRSFGAELPGLGHLAFVDPIKQMAVMKQKAGTAALFQADFGEHQVEAEDLHVGDAFAPLSIDIDVELRAASGFGDREAAGLLVEPRRPWATRANAEALTKSPGSRNLGGMKGNAYGEQRRHLRHAASHPERVWRDADPDKVQPAGRSRLYGDRPRQSGRKGRACGSRGGQIRAETKGQTLMAYAPKLPEGITLPPNFNHRGLHDLTSRESLSDRGLGLPRQGFSNLSKRTA
jgi:hypothetical protein